MTGRQRLNLREDFIDTVKKPTERYLSKKKTRRQLLNKLSAGHVDTHAHYHLAKNIQEHFDTLHETQTENDKQHEELVNAIVFAQALNEFLKHAHSQSFQKNFQQEITENETIKDSYPPEDIVAYLRDECELSISRRDVQEKMAACARILYLWSGVINNKKVTLVIPAAADGIQMLESEEVSSGDSETEKPKRVSPDEALLDQYIEALILSARGYLARKPSLPRQVGSALFHNKVAYHKHEDLALGLLEGLLPYLEGKRTPKEKLSAAKAMKSVLEEQLKKKSSRAFQVSFDARFAGIKSAMPENSDATAVAECEKLMASWNKAPSKSAPAQKATLKAVATTF